jgi:putative addiction module component (TIGR02574 family)
MSDTDIAEILKLPAEERLRLVELIWQSLNATPSAIPLSDAHRAAIDEELAAHRRNPDDVLTVEQVFSEVRGSR